MKAKNIILATLCVAFINCVAGDQKPETKQENKTDQTIPAAQNQSATTQTSSQPQDPGDDSYWDLKVPKSWLTYGSIAIGSILVIVGALAGSLYIYKKLKDRKDAARAQLFRDRYHEDAPSTLIDPALIPDKVIIEPL